MDQLVVACGYGEEELTRWGQQAGDRVRRTELMGGREEGEGEEGEEEEGRGV